MGKVYYGGPFSGVMLPWLLGSTARLCYAAAGEGGDGGSPGGGSGGAGGADTVGGAGGGSDTIGGAGAGGGTIANPGQDTAAGGQGGGTGAQQATWPDDWRARLAGKDEDLLKRIGRFASPENVFKSYVDLHKQLSSGAYVQKLPENATDAEMAAWRKGNGIPDKPEGYLEKLPNGLIVGEDDKALLTGFLAEAHGVHAPPEMVGKFVDWYYKTSENLQAEQAQKDAQIKDAGIEELRSEWGTEYKGNLNAIANFVPADLYGALMTARMPDGTLVGNHTGALKWLVSAALDINPAARITPAESRLGGATGIESRLDEIRTMMRTDRAAYDKNEKVQAEFRDLTNAQILMRERAGQRAA